MPLSKARDLDPDKTSIREALGRAYFRSSQFEAARTEFEAVVERARAGGFGRVVLCVSETAETPRRLYERMGFQRLPDRDWSPNGDIRLLGFCLDLGS